MMEFCNNIKTKYMTYLVEGLIRLINVENPLSVKKDPLKTIEKKILKIVRKLFKKDS